MEEYLNIKAELSLLLLFLYNVKVMSQAMVPLFWLILVIYDEMTPLAQGVATLIDD